jgi:hypothetical protein
MLLMCRKTFCFRLWENICIVDICLRYRWRCSNALQTHCQWLEYESKKSTGYWPFSCLLKSIWIFESSSESWCQSVSCTTHNQYELVSSLELIGSLSGQVHSFLRHKKHARNCVLDLSYLLADTSSDMHHSNRWSGHSKEESADISVSHLTISFVTVKHWLITFDSASVSRSRVSET